MNITTPPPKVIGAMKHLLLELQKIGIINEVDRDHLNDRYIRGHINSFGHLAEWLLAYRMISTHNYDQIVQYGFRYGETR